MRLLPGLALVAALLCIPASAEPTQNPPWEVVESQPFVAVPRASFTLVVPEASLVQVSISFNEGVFEGMVLEGPGSCLRAISDALPRSNVYQSCGGLAAGEYRLAFTVNGLGSQGSIDVQGGYLLPPGVAEQP